MDILQLVTLIVWAAIAYFLYQLNARMRENNETLRQISFYLDPNEPKRDSDPGGGGGGS